MEGSRGEGIGGMPRRGITQGTAVTAVTAVTAKGSRGVAAAMCRDPRGSGPVEKNDFQGPMSVNRTVGVEQLLASPSRCELDLSRSGQLLA